MVASLWLLQLAPSTRRPGHRRVTKQPVIAGGSSRFAGIPPTVTFLLRPWAVEYSRPRRKDSPITAWTARKSVPSEDKCWHRPDTSTVCTFGPIQFGPAVASPFPCVWRRPRLAVAGAGIADKQGASLKPFEYCKVIITCHLIFGMGKRIFSDALPPRSFLSGTPSVGNAGPREGRSVPKSLRGSRAAHGYYRPPIRQPPRVVRIRG